MYCQTDLLYVLIFCALQSRWSTRVIRDENIVSIQLGLVANLTFSSYLVSLKTIDTIDQEQCI